MRTTATRAYAPLAVLMGVVLLVSACGDNNSGGPAAAPPAGPLAITISETATAIDVPGGASRVHASKDPFHLTLASSGAPDVTEAATGLYFMAADQRVSLDRLAGSHAIATELQLTPA